MKRTYQPELDARIRIFLERKDRQYPELHLLEKDSRDIALRTLSNEV